MRSAIRSLFVIAVIVLASAAAVLVDPPDLCLNEITGLIESVDTAWSGANYNVRSMQVTTGGQQVSSTMLTSNAAQDVDPKLAIAPNGDVLVVWWRDLTKDALIYRKRSLASGVWGAERLAGAPAESNSHPRVVYAEGRPCVAYQIQNTRTRSVGCQIIDDDVEPFRSVVATTTFNGQLDLKLNSESRQLWVTWIDNGSTVGYSEYAFDKQLWSVPAFESFATDSPAAARARIRNRVLGL
jgi:hypothetical protein